MAINGFNMLPSMLPKSRATPVPPSNRDFQFVASYLFVSFDFRIRTRRPNVTDKVSRCGTFGTLPSAGTGTPSARRNRYSI